MEVLSGLIGAIIGAVVALIAVLLPLWNKRQENRRKMNDLAVETLAQTDSFLSDLGEYLEQGPPLDESTIKELHKERKLVRTNLMMLRQMYPQPDVRHDAERLWQEIDKSVTFLEPDPGEEEQQWTIMNRAWRNAHNIADTITRRLRDDRGRVVSSYRGSQGAG
jgi:type II secretory pathway pseudopilin PulG